MRRSLLRRSLLRRPPWWLLVGTVLAAALVAWLLTWSSGGQGASFVPLRTVDVPAAVRALEQRLGRTPTFVEINAKAQGVNLYLPSDDAAGGTQAWYWANGVLEGPSAPPDDETRLPFGLEGVALGQAEAVARAAQAKFPTATLTQFALLKLPSQGVVWSVSMQSSRGGRIDLTFSPAGTFVSADLR